MARYSAHAAPAPTSGRVLLSVPYDDYEGRAAVKRCGAKWDAVLRVWWIDYWEAVENPGIYRWVADPDMARQLKQANDFNNYGPAPQGKAGKPSKAETPQKDRKGLRKPRTQRPKGSLMVSA